MVRLFCAVWNVVVAAVGFTLFFGATLCYYCLTKKGKDAVAAGWMRSVEKHYEQAKPNRKDATVQANPSRVVVTACQAEGRASYPHTNN